jgi:hypothetical protein
VVLVLAVHLLMALQAMGELGLPVKAQMAAVFLFLIRVLEAPLVVAVLEVLGVTDLIPVGGMAEVDQQTASPDPQFFTLMEAVAVDTILRLGMGVREPLEPQGKAAKLIL